MSAQPQLINKVDQSPSERLLEMAASDMASVDQIILERMQSPVGLIPDLAKHLISAGGKRLRPLLTVATSLMCGYKGDKHHKLAAAVEFIHSATLLHDDVVDDSTLRRGKKPANLVWGNSPSILVGDFLFARAFNLMVETNSLEALKILSNASSIIAEGEVRQLAALGNMQMDEDSYMQVISAKTAALFSASTEVSAVITAQSDEKRKALHDYGLKIGLAFQLVDDALDYSGFESKLGKSLGDDFREGKMTLPVIRAIEFSNHENDSFWHRVIVERNQNNEDFKKAMLLIKSSKSIESTIELARQYSLEAKELLNVFDASPWRTTLQELASYIVERAS
ncbi:MAG: polyprenyl synthetase family protein [Hellea sp.]|nr:polyprenyl synthetase family protein [Hellea sp.]